jgi:adenosine deaminase
VTIHVGEEGGEYGIAEIREVVSTLRPDRIGHGIPAAICATPNLLTKALEGEEALRHTVLPAFSEHNLQLTIATDGPEMMRTHLRDEFELLLRISALDESQVSEADRWGHGASFVQLLA